MICTEQKVTLKEEQEENTKPEKFTLSCILTLFLTATSKEDESLLRKLIHSKLVSTKADLEILQKDPNSPLYSVKTFEALNL